MIIDLRAEAGERPLFNHPWEVLVLLRRAAQRLYGPSEVPAQSILFWCGSIVKAEIHLHEAKSRVEQIKRGCKP